MSPFTMDKACEKNSDCENGGTCMDGKCFCTEKFGGLHCESKIVIYIRSM